VVGALQLTDASWLPAVAATFDGLPGAGGGVGTTEFEAADCVPLPVAFDAVTLNVYVVPFVRLPTVADVAGGDPETVVVVWAAPPMNGVTVYAVGGPPVVGAFHETVADAGPAVAATLVGVPGTCTGPPLGE
jgi:hypothetical protein